MRRARPAGVPIVASCARCQSGRVDRKLLHGRTIVRRGSLARVILVAGR